MARGGATVVHRRGETKAHTVAGMCSCPCRVWVTNCLELRGPVEASAAKGTWQGVQDLKPDSVRYRIYRKGAAALELAVVTPLLVLLVLGMMEFGSLMMVQQILTNAAREGCRLAVVGDATTQDVMAKVTSYSPRTQGATVSVSHDPPSMASTGDMVTVTVSIDFDAVSWLSTPMYLSGHQLTAYATMRRQ